MFTLAHEPEVFMAPIVAAIMSDENRRVINRNIFLKPFGIVREQEEMRIFDDLCHARDRGQIIVQGQCWRRKVRFSTGGIGARQQTSVDTNRIAIADTPSQFDILGKMR